MQQTLLVLPLRSCLHSAALFNPETSILIQKRHPYTGNLNRELSGDSKNAFLHCGDVLDSVNPVNERVSSPHHSIHQQLALSVAVNAVYMTGKS